MARLPLIFMVVFCAVKSVYAGQETPDSLEAYFNFDDPSPLSCLRRTFTIFFVWMILPSISTQSPTENKNSKTLGVSSFRYFVSQYKLRRNLRDCNTEIVTCLWDASYLGKTRLRNWILFTTCPVTGLNCPDKKYFYRTIKIDILSCFQNAVIISP